MRDANRIINPNTKYTMQVIIDYDPSTGDTQLQVRNRSGINVSMLQVSTLLAEHNATLLRTIVTNTVKMEKVTEEETAKPNGGDHNAT